MKIRTIRRTILGSAIALAAGTAFAQQGPSPDELLSQYDKDNSESLSLTEFKDLYRAQADTQGDNFSEQAMNKFEEADSNSNDELAMNELRQALPLHDQMSEHNTERSTADNSQWQDSDRSQDRDSRSAINSADSRAELSAAVANEADVNVDTWEQEERNSDRDRNSDRYQLGESDSDQSLEMIAREQPDELEGWEIENAQDDDMGEIENIVRDNESGDLYALINTGGFIGFGESEAVIPLSELQKQSDEDDELVFTGQDSEIQEYDESQFEMFTTETAQIEAREERRTEIASQSNR